MRTGLRLVALGLIAMTPLSAIETMLVTGGGAMLAVPAMADDDDDDDDDDDRRPAFRSQRVSDDDDDDDDDDRAPRRRVERPAPRPVAPRRSRPEIVASGVDAAALARIRAAGFTVLAERRLALLPESTVRLAPPRNLSDAGARARIGELAAGASVDVNALYRPNAGKGCSPETCFPYRRENWTVAGCGARGGVGMIDTGVSAAHPALAGAKVETLLTRGDGRAPSSATHGTEVAILLAGGRGGAGDLRIVAVDAFHRAGGADRADVFDLVAAIDALSERGVSVVNLSLAGPANAVLDRAGAAAAARGMILVAAVGNEGPKSKPRFPSAYPWAVAVTAIDARGEPYARAGRGAHVAFAAPGVRLELPDETLAPGRRRSGTSYAAPLVTAMLSALRAQASDRPAAEAVSALAAHVEDKGAPGRDPVYGWGALVGAKGCPATARLSAE